MMLKFFAGPNFHASKIQITCYKMQGVTDLPPLQESRPRDSQTRRGKKGGVLDTG